MRQRVSRLGHLHHRADKGDKNPLPSDDTHESRTPLDGNGAAQTDGLPDLEEHEREETLTVRRDPDEEEEKPQLSVVACATLLILDTVLVGVTAEFLVSSIDGLTAANPSLSKEWVSRRMEVRHLVIVLIKC